MKGLIDQLYFKTMLHYDFGFHLIADLLLSGERQYIFGDKMSTVDCSAFGIFSQMRWLTPKSCPCYKVFEG
jgi:hypothetical protein